MKRIYIDHAATTPLCRTAFAAMLPFLKGEFGNPSSPHGWGKVPREAMERARLTIAECIHADPSEIFFTGSGTEADNWVIQGTSGRLAVSAYEHHAILNAVRFEADNGREVTFVKPGKRGDVTSDSLKDLKLAKGLVSIMTANNEIGAVNPIPSLCTCAHEKGFLFHTDAVQAVGHIPVNVRTSGVDFLSASAHKFNGPKGVGFLFIRKGIPLAALLRGGQQENGMRAGTEHVAGIVGMAAALLWNCERMERHKRHLDRLAERFVNGIRKTVPDAVFPGGTCPERLPGFVSVTFPGHSAEGLLHILDLKGIAVSAGAACDSRTMRISHVLKAIRFPATLARCTLRVTFGVENTLEEVDTVTMVLANVTRSCGG